MKLCPVCNQHYDGGARFCPVDGAPLAEPEGAAAPAASPAAEVLGGRFAVGALLRVGRTGELHRGVDQSTGAEVAIKRVAPNVVSHPQVASRIDRELGSLEGLASASSAKIFGGGRHQERLWVASEWVPNAQSLEALVAARGPLPLEEAINIVGRIGEALLEAGKLGIVHRDLAPKNVLLGDGQLKLINWALPVAAHEKIAGVPTFVSPEHVEGRLVDQRSNIYSLAAIFYFTMTGASPFIGDTESVHRAHVSSAVAPLSSRASTSAALDAVVTKAMDKSAARRYMTLRQFLDELSNAAKARTAAAHVESTTMGAPALVAPAVPVGATIAGMPSPVIGSPFARSGAAELGQTLVGVIGGNDVNARTKQVDAVDPALIESLRQPPAATPATPALAPAAGPAPAPSVVIAPDVPAAAPMAAVAPATVLQAPALALPVVPAGAPAAAPPAASEASRASELGPDGKPKFRETLWFKKGELDALSAQDSSGGEGNVDSLPIEDRYNDDGTVSGGDAARYSLRTGGDARAARMTDGKRLAGGSMSEDELVSEMKGGRGKWILIGGAVIVVLVIVILMFAM